MSTATEQNNSSQENFPRAGKKEWIGLAVLALPCLLYSMDLTVLILAIPQLSADLKPSSSELLWIVDIYGFLVAGMLITMGTLGDRIGRRKLLFIGATFFGIASILAAFSTSSHMLIVTRAILGLAGATIAPSTLSLIRNMFHDPKQRSTAIGVWITSYSLGGLIGPVVGGIMIEYFWWGSVFLLSVPVMILILILGPYLLPEFKDPNAGKIDILSAALSIAAVLSIIFGIKHSSESGFDVLAAGSIIAGFIIGGIFIHRQRRIPNPLIDLNLFRRRAFSSALFAYLLATFTAFGSFIFTAQYLQLVLDLTPLEAGLYSIPSSFGFIAGAMLAPILSRKIRPAYLMGGGFILAAIGSLILAQVGIFPNVWTVVAASIISGLGMAPVVTLTTDIIIGSAPPEKAGAASGISETCAEFGGAAGIAILGSISTAVYRMIVSERMPAGIPGDGIEVIMSTLGAAINYAGEVQNSVIASELIIAAKAAFTSAVITISYISVALAIAASIYTIISLKKVKPTSEQEKDTPILHGEIQPENI